MRNSARRFPHHSAAQLREGRFDCVVLNGKSAIEQLSGAGIVELSHYDVIDHRTMSIEIWGGESFGSRFIGWNRYLQSAIPNSARELLSNWLRRYDVS